MAAGDPDADGDDDLLLGADHLWWLENSDDGRRWTPHLIHGSDAPVTAVEWADLDGDGDLDAISGGADFARVHENQSWGEAWGYLSLSTPSGGDGGREVLAADVDADGDLDVVALSRASGLHVFLSETPQGPLLPLPDRDEPLDGACGCSADLGAGAATWLVVLPLIAARRRRTAGSATESAA